MIQKTKSNRKVIGRSLTNIKEPIKNELGQEFILNSGKKAKFNLITVSAEELKDKTYVNIITNGREQNSLTEEALEDISRTLKLQQFFPAIGRKIEGRIELLDGSRRRACALLENLSLNILVTEDILSISDAKQLAKDIQTAKEHNIRELGLQLLAQRESGLNQKEIAKINNLSASKVTRAIQAALVPDDMLIIFPIRDELNTSDYKFLLDIHMSFKTKNLDVEELILQIDEEKEKLDISLAPEEIKNKLIKLYKSFSEQMLNTNKKSKKALVSKLWDFDDPNVYARKKIKDRSTSFEFNRIPISIQNKIESYIKETIKEHYKN